MASRAFCLGGDLVEVPRLGDPLHSRLGWRKSRPRYRAGPCAHIRADGQGGAPAAAPDEAERWFNRLVELAKNRHARVEIGRFGAHMQVHLVNDGPVTFWLEAH